MNEEEILSQASFWLVVSGSLLIGLEGLGLLAGNQLNPLNMITGRIAETVRTAIYILVGLSGLHQAYFGYSSFKKELEN
ncbi:hypothetical protein [Candidatus Nanohalococcus occultus]|uniref:DUF378 domain-containing protein n=1 Tax=Candidatus Nanohalococcus occultus TaxID=2978047 RepID=A0ABY8CE66_9ARCH|nr:hypothetical protein SVXNc_0461 [Candidatus Nanohaloarchaeota archaeon SVXNc]